MNRYDRRPKPPLAHFTLAARHTLCGGKAAGAPPSGAKVCSRCAREARGRLIHFQKALAAR